MRCAFAVALAVVVQVGLARAETGRHGADTRRVFERPRMTRQAHMSAAVVIAVAVRHGANEAAAVRQSRQARQQLTHIDARNRSGNRLVRAANLGRGAGLEVQGVDMTGAAVLDDEDTGAGPPARFLMR